MRERREYGRGIRDRVRHYGNAKHRGRRHRRDSDLNLGTALITSRVLLQAGVPVDSLVAIAFLMCVRKRHGWRLRSLDARLCNADRLGEKHRCRDETADCTTNSRTVKCH